MITLLRNNCLRQPDNREKGFSLIELLIVVGIISMVGVIIYTFFGNITKKSTAERTAALVQQKARLAVDVISRDLRMMGLDATGDIGSALFTDGSNNGGHGFSSSSAGSDHIFITADLDYDGKLDSDYERIGYWYDATNRTVNVLTWDNHGGSLQPFSGPLVDNVTNFELTYRDANMNVVTPSSNGKNVFFITISLTVREKKAGETGTNPEAFVERSYSETVRVRNRL